MLLVASLVFYAWGEAPYLALVLGSVAFNYAIGARDRRGRAIRVARKRWLVLGVAGNLAALAVFKYANFAVANVNALRADRSAVTPLALAADPAAARHLVLHVPRDLVRRRRLQGQRARAERNLPRFALYILLFPQLIAGPIIRWRDIAAQLAGARRSASPTSPTACAASCSASARRC